MRRWKLGAVSAVLVLAMLLGGCTTFMDAFNESLANSADGPADATSEPVISGTDEPQETGGGKRADLPAGEAVPADVQAAWASYAANNGFAHFPTIKSVYTSSERSDAHKGYNVLDDATGDSWQSGTTGTSWQSAADDEAPVIRFDFEKPMMISHVRVTSAVPEEDAAIVEVMDMYFDDGEKIGVQLPRDGATFSQVFAPRETSYLEFHVQYIYAQEPTVPGGIPSGIAQMFFWFDPDDYFVQQWMADEGYSARGGWETIDGGSAPEATSEAPAAPTPKPTPVPVSEGGSAKDIVDATGYIGPKWWDWRESAGDGGWGFEETDLRAGNWLSQDGQISLYIDYDSSPDGFSYGISCYGEVDEYYAEIPNTRKSYAKALDGHGYEFTVENKGELMLKKGGETHTLYLVRSKYRQND